MRPSTSRDRNRDEETDAGQPISLADQPRPATARFRTLVVGDSALMRRLVTRILETDSRLETVGSARNMTEALSRIEYYRPDLVTFDTEGPSAEGETESLAQLRELHPHLRTVAFRGLDDRSARLIMEAMLKTSAHPEVPGTFPSTVECDDIAFAKDLLRKVCIAIMQTNQKAAPVNGQTLRPMQESKPRSTGPLSATPNQLFVGTAYPQILAIGSSTGGPAALNELLSAFPANFPVPILIVQHMPPHFTKLLADRLAKSCRLPVVEAQHGMAVQGGQIFVAPGDFHMEVVRGLHGVQIQLSKGDPENSCRPAVDVLFRSVAETYHRSSIAVVLTGMGQDGLRGVRTLKAKGVPVLVQDRETSVVWGMPGAVAEAGLADYVLPIADILSKIMEFL